MRLTVVALLTLAACGPAPQSLLATKSPRHAHGAQPLPLVGQLVRVHGLRARVAFVAHNGVDEHVAEVQYANGKRDTVRICEIEERFGLSGAP